MAHAYNPSTQETEAIYDDDGDDVKDRRTGRNSGHGENKKQTGVNWIIRGIHKDAELRAVLKTALFRHRMKI